VPLPDGEGAAVQEVLGLVIDNNCIHRLGTVWHGCYGIVNRFASRTRITHNEIFDTHWDAIGLDARWNWKGEKYSHGNVVAYNHLHHLGLRYHTDAAGSTSSVRSIRTSTITASTTASPIRTSADTPASTWTNNRAGPWSRTTWCTESNGMRTSSTRESTTSSATTSGRSPVMA
jgi:hypothetical protein